jgi:hypothetical protein
MEAKVNVQRFDYMITLSKGAVTGNLVTMFNHIIKNKG